MIISLPNIISKLNINTMAPVPTTPNASTDPKNEHKKKIAENTNKDKKKSESNNGAGQDFFHNDTKLPKKNPALQKLPAGPGNKLLGREVDAAAPPSNPKINEGPGNGLVRNTPPATNGKKEKNPVDPPKGLINHVTPKKKGDESSPGFNQGSGQGIIAAPKTATTPNPTSPLNDQGKGKNVAKEGSINTPKKDGKSKEKNDPATSHHSEPKIKK